MEIATVLYIHYISIFFAELLWLEMCEVEPREISVRVQMLKYWM
jgi:hypothetical protein